VMGPRFSERVDWRFLYDPQGVAKQHDALLMRSAGNDSKDFNETR
jgi:hypothetical protein